MASDLTRREAVIAEWLRPQSKGIAAPITEWTCIGTRPGPDKRTNEDRVLFARVPDDRGSAADAFVVCDGIGGLDRGDDCAELAISAFMLGFAGLFAGGAPVPVALREAVSFANRRVWEAFAGRGGSTLAAVIIYQGQAVVAWVGDTRVFLAGDKDVEQITHDDTLRGALDAAGAFDADPTPEHAKLLQFVGMGEELEPHLRPVDPRDARFVLICTDGAYRFPPPMHGLICRNAKSARLLVERLLVCADSIGMRDDSTVAAFSTQLLNARPHDPLLTLRLWGVKDSLAVWIDGSVTRDIRNLIMQAPRPAFQYHMGRTVSGSSLPIRVGSTTDIQLGSGESNEMDVRLGPADEREPKRISKKKRRTQEGLPLDGRSNGVGVGPAYEPRVTIGPADDDGHAEGKPSGRR